MIAARRPGRVLSLMPFIAYRTNPHVDQAEAGRRAADLLYGILAGRIRPCQALAKPPQIEQLEILAVKSPFA